MSGQTIISIIDALGQVRQMAVLSSDGTASGVLTSSHVLADSAGNFLNPSTSDLQVVGNSYLANAATAANQTITNSYLSTANGYLGTSTTYLGTSVGYLANAATAVNQTTTNGLLSNTTSLLTTANGYLAYLTNAATAANQTTTNNLLVNATSQQATMIGYLANVSTIENQQTVISYLSQIAANGGSKSVQQNDTTTVLAANAVFYGNAHDTGAAAGSTIPYSYFNGYFYSDQSGIAYLDGSNDQTNWFQTASSNLVGSTPLILTVPVLFRYNRTRLYNTSTSIQNTVVVQSSYSGG